MKNLNSLTLIQDVEKISNSKSLEYGDIVVYNEMSDQTSVRLNLIDQIHSQLNQLEEMSLRRQYLMKELLQNITE